MTTRTNRPELEVYLEVGAKRVFASAVEWPGWARSGRDEDAAVRALLGHADRYRAAVSRARQGFIVPEGVRVVGRVPGNATTDFGAPAVEAPGDGRPIDPAEARRLLALLRAAWRALDGAAEAAAAAALRTGPRGGGRDVPGIVSHVLGAERAYLSKLGGRAAPIGEEGVAAVMAAVREGYEEAFRARARGEPPPRPPTRAALWSPRYAVRRSAWHALDHAWEIEDRAE